MMSPRWARLVGTMRGLFNWAPMVSPASLPMARKAHDTRPVASISTPGVLPPYLNGVAISR